jgi:hypothetical protein
MAAVDNPASRTTIRFIAILPFTLWDPCPAGDPGSGHQWPPHPPDPASAQCGPALRRAPWRRPPQARAQPCRFGRSSFVLSESSADTTRRGGNMFDRPSDTACHPSLPSSDIEGAPPARPFFAKAVKSPFSVRPKPPLRSALAGRHTMTRGPGEPRCGTAPVPPDDTDIVARLSAAFAIIIDTMGRKVHGAPYSPRLMRQSRVAERKASKPVSAWSWQASSPTTICVSSPPRSEPSRIGTHARARSRDNRKTIGLEAEPDHFAAMTVSAR